MSKPMGLKEFIKVVESPDEALNIQQRLKLSRSLKKNKAKIAMGRKRAARKTANMDTLKKRAMKQARNMIIKKITKGQDKGDMSMARKQSIEKRLDKMKPKIAKIAKKILPKVRKMEMERKKGKQSSD
jgi:thiamine kinase-like enzyme